MVSILKKVFGTAQDRALRGHWKLVREINRIELDLQRLTDDELRGKTQEFRTRVAKGESLDALLPEAYAVVKNTCRRLMGTPVHVSGYDQQWDMVPFDVQIVGAIAMHKGCIAEMMTGEGKTLTAAMPLYLAAMTGKAVHLVTVNDYLAQRDCDWIGSIFRWLGLQTAALITGTPPSERKELYKADILYGTASEFGFDYLRDNSMSMTKEEQVQRGHYFAIVDEIDSILIDEARTPLIISGPVPESRQMYHELQGGVAELVRVQRDYCNKIAGDARKALEKCGVVVTRSEEEGLEAAEALKKKGRKQTDEEKEAYRRLWLVSKGTPRHKILKRMLEDPDVRYEIDQWDLYYYHDQNKEERAKALAELYIVVDEKSSEYELTDKGIGAWQEATGGSADDFVMLDLSDEYIKLDADTSLSKEELLTKKQAVREEDAKRKERAHNLRQLLRAHLLMERDVDYMVQEGKVIIIDENTGRPQPGRRFSDGLHQAIEAKEGVPIQQETQTYATITLQNYFRMYDRLAGMTGTATTEAGEFKEIYKLEVLEIPTNKPCIRKDFNDEIYMTEREKYAAILKDIASVHSHGRPILVGTESVDISEKLSRILKQNHLEHTVLNAKNHAREAEIIAHAGQHSAITVATNMAGRGTDIKLGPGIADMGGLYVVGTSRHQSRRIDRQLRGRSARQGDPGSSKFYVSFEDSLMRLFASPKLTSVLQRFRPPEGEPISAGILNKSIETAQKRVEQRNYVIRKHTLEYDDVMNRQRQEVYAFRNEILHRADILELAKEVLRHTCSIGAEEFFRSKGQEAGWDPEGYRRWLIDQFPVSFKRGVFDDDYLEREDIEKLAEEKIVNAFQEKVSTESGRVSPQRLQEGQQPQDIVQEAVRNLMLHKVDALWQEHLLTMDHLRADVHLRSVGQKDPLIEFKHEAFRIFDELTKTLHQGIAADLFRFQMIQMVQPVEIEQLLKKLRLETERSFATEMEAPEPAPQPPPDGQPAAEIPPGGPFTDLAMKSEPVHVEPKIGRNDPCPCGSGKKYKKCHGQKES